MNIRDYGQKIVDAFLDRFELYDRYRFISKPMGGSTLGECDHTELEISVNSNITNEDDWLDTLLHEIAHAITYWGFKERGHGKRFKETCDILRCCGKSRVDHTVLTNHIPKYTIKCSMGCWSADRDRLRKRTRRLYASGIRYCSKCGGGIIVVQNR